MGLGFFFGGGKRLGQLLRCTSADERPGSSLQAAKELFFFILLFAEVCKIPPGCPAPCCIQNIFIRFSPAIPCWVSLVPKASRSAGQGLARVLGPGGFSPVCAKGAKAKISSCSQNLGRERQTAGFEGHPPKAQRPRNARFLTRPG